MDQSSVDPLATLCLRELTDSFTLRELTRADIPADLKKKLVIHYLLFNCATACDYCGEFRRPLAEKYNPIKKTSKYTCRDCFECGCQEGCNGTFKKYIIKCIVGGYRCATCGCECCMGVGCGRNASMYEWARCSVKPEWVIDHDFYCALCTYPDEIKDPQIMDLFKSTQIEEGIGVPEGFACPQREDAIVGQSPSLVGRVIRGTPFRVRSKGIPIIIAKHSNCTGKYLDRKLVALSEAEKTQCRDAGWEVE